MQLRNRMAAVRNSKSNHTRSVTKLTLRPWRKWDCSEVTSVNTSLYTSFPSDITTHIVLTVWLVDTYHWLIHNLKPCLWQAFHTRFTINFAQNRTALKMSHVWHRHVLSTFQTFRILLLPSGANFLILVIFFWILEVSRELHLSMLQAKLYLQRNCTKVKPVYNGTARTRFVSVAVKFRSIQVLKVTRNWVSFPLNIWFRFNKVPFRRFHCVQLVYNLMQNDGKMRGSVRK